MIEKWYVDRFMTLRETTFRDPLSYFHRYASLSEKEAYQTASSLWRDINLANLNENIIPTRQRADLIIHKEADHAISQLFLRKL